MIRVMIVATYCEVREGLSNLLRLAGDIEVTNTIANLAGAIQQAGLNPPDVVLVDLEMPGGEGYETIRQLKRQRPCIKTVALTAHDYPEAKEKAFQAGASSVIVKGLGLPQMVAAIQAIV